MAAVEVRLMAHVATKEIHVTLVDSVATSVDVY